MRRNEDGWASGPGISWDPAKPGDDRTVHVHVYLNGACECDDRQSGPSKYAVDSPDLEHKLRLLKERQASQDEDLRREAFKNNAPIRVAAAELVAALKERNDGLAADRADHATAALKEALKVADRPEFCPGCSNDVQACDCDANVKIQAGDSPPTPLMRSPFLVRDRRG